MKNKERVNNILLNHSVQPLAKAIEGMVGSTNKWVAPVLAGLPPEDLAAITVQTLLHSCGHKLAGAAYAVANSIITTRQLTQLRKEKPALYRSIENGFSCSCTGIHKYRAYRRILNNLEYTESPDKVNQLRAGMWLIVKAIQHTHLFERRMLVDRAGMTQAILCMTPSAEAFVQKYAEKISLLDVLMPVSDVPPLHWDAINHGGYHNIQVPFVKTRNQKHYDMLQTAAPTVMFRAVNHVQATVWAADARLARLLFDRYTAGTTLPGLPDASVRELPERPWKDGDIPADSVKREWKIAARHVYDQRIRDQSKRLAALQALKCACDAPPAFYFPHNIDFRGRVYPLTHSLHPQGDDLCKALLMFADGRQVTTAGPAWDAIRKYTANLMGKDKLPPTGKFAAFDSAWSTIMGIGRLLQQGDLDGALIHPLIQDADCPLELLSTCLHLFEAVEMGALWRRPVFVDGSCNGLQHLCALSRDTYGGKLVNLTDTDIPQDLYSVVAEAVAQHVMADEATSEQAWWRGKISRSLVKRCVMTTPYGATRYGYAQQVEDLWRKTTGVTLENKYTTALSHVIADSMAEVLDGAMRVMRWFQQCAAAAAKQGGGIAWTAPAGLVVYQEYKAPKLKTMRIMAGRTLWQVRIAIGEGTALKKQKQVNAIAPNVVHSIDASHLALTVNKCAAAGIPVAVVHDSYGAHPADMEQLNEILRDTFVSLHTSGILENLRAQWVDSYGEDAIPPVPVVGTLDIHNARKATYMFY